MTERKSFYLLPSNLYAHFDIVLETLKTASKPDHLP